jgi:TFIIF-interacting CTD phosphatase-like protein
VYANQLMDQLDPRGKLGRLRLFREHCTEMRNARVKDLSLLGRPLERVAIIDNSPVAYLFQPRNAIPIVSWFDDRRDTEFERLLPMLEELATCTSVYDVLDVWNCTVH